MSRQTFTDAALPGPDTAATALASFTSEANLWNPAIETPIPALDLVAGKMYLLRCGGIMQSASAINWTFTPRFGQSSTPASNISLVASAVVPTTGTVPASSPWWAEFLLTCQKSGIVASGSTIIGTGFIILPNTATAFGLAVPMGGTSSAVADRTSAQGLVLSATCGTSSATNSIQALWRTLQALN